MTTDEAVAEEREACAKIAEDMRVKERYCVGRDLLTVDDAVATKHAIAAAIRARGKKDSTRID